MCAQYFVPERLYFYPRHIKNIAALQPLVGHDRSDLISYDLLPFGLHSEAAREGWSKMYHKKRPLDNLKAFAIYLMSLLLIEKKSRQYHYIQNA